MSILRIEDYSGSAQVVAFPKVFAQSQQFLAVDMVVKVRGRVDADEKGVQIIADRIAPLKVNYNNARQIAIHIRGAYDTPENSNALKDILHKQKGKYRQHYIYTNNENELIYHLNYALHLQMKSSHALKRC